jgi:hypothetical protein
MVDVRIIIRRHFPVRVGPGRTRIIEKVAEDIDLRRRPSRKLRGPERVERALAEGVLPRVEHPFDRGAVVAASKDICAHVSTACADPRLAEGGAHVLVLIDTFACPVVFRPPPQCELMMRNASAPKSFVERMANPCMDVESRLPAKEPRWPISVIGDGKHKPVEEPCVEERFDGWLPW